MKDKKPSRGERAEVEALRRRVAELEAACKKLSLTGEALGQSESLLRAVLSSVQGTIIGVFDRKCKHLFVGMPPELERRFGFTAEQAVGTSLRDLLSPSDAEKRIAAIEGVFRTGKPVRFEGSADAPSGSVWEEALLSPVKDASGQISAVVAFVRDVTEQRRAHEQLAEQRQLLSNILRHIPHGVFWKDRHSVYLGCNDNFAKAAGLKSPEDVVGKTDADLVSRAEGAAKYSTGDRQVIETQEPLLGREETLRSPDGRARTVLASKVPLRDAAGEVMGVLGIFTDITERKAAVQALRRSKQRFQDIIDNTWDIVFEVDPEGNYTFVNKAGERVTGYPLEELLTTNMRDLVAPEYLVEVFRRMTKRIRGQSLSQPFDFDILHRDGHRVRLELTTAGVEKDGKLVAVQGIARDVTERKQAEDALRESEQQVRLILEHTTDGINIAKTDLETGDRRLLMCNDRYAEMSGRTREELMASVDIEEFIERRETGEEAFDRWRRLSQGLAYRGRASWIRPDGAENYYEWTAVPIRRGDDLYVVGIDRDVTQRVRAEEELRRNEEAGRRFRAQLTALHEVTIELSMADSLDDLCRRAVELGRGTLGFDRLGLWFTTDEPRVLAGSFGIDEQGNLRDERGARVSIAGDHLADEILSKRTVVAVVEDAVIYDFEDRPVGRATRAIGALWDGDDVLGYLSTDNLLSGEEITPNQRELLRLYASALGHLCSRKRAEDELRRSEEAERNFRARLTALHEVTVELSAAGSFDELCRRAVELGRSRLGFDRLGTWFLEEPPNTVRGGFGTDEHGRISDERAVTGPVAEGTLMWQAVTEQLPFGLIEDAELLKAEGKVVGRGTLAMASLWDGERVIGCICMDNLLQGKPVTGADCELLRLYASVLGHLCSRQKAEEELRRSEEAERNFRARLTALHEVTVELSRAGSFDELCRRAVELGRSRLSFDRLGTWFLDETTNAVRGSFGTDEHGQISDERSERWPVNEGTLMWRVLAEELPVGLAEDAEELDAEGKVVGRRTLAIASMWDGERVTGCICMDNRLQGKPVTQADCELLRLYASALGHLCSRQRAEEELLVKNSAIHSAINAISLASLDGKVTYANPSYVRLWGYDSEEEILGMPIVSFWSDPSQVREVLPKMAEAGGWTGELTALRKDGTTFDVELSANTVTDEAGQPICRMASFVDISERKRAERAMRAAQRKLMTAREEERRHLASELHDSVGQGLIALELTLEAALTGRSERSIAEGVERTRAQCHALVQEVRAIGRGLYPATLESMGLEAAVRQLARDFESQTAIVVRWSKHCRPGSMREDVEIALFRIGQEAVSNAIRHGQAERVELSLVCPEGEAVFSVTDNGIGLDVELARGKGLGLTTMQERAEGIGGKFEILSRPGQTIVRVRVPAELARRPGYEG